VVNAADPDALGRQIVDTIPVTPCASERCAILSHRPPGIGATRDTHGDGSGRVAAPTGG